MKAYRIDSYIIAAETPESAKEFFKHEINDNLPETIEEVSLKEEISYDGGKTMTIKEFINKELDNRRQWLTMGVPCDMLRPFVVKEVS